MNKISEKQLQKWEKAPLQYRAEIERTERQFTDKFLAEMKTGNRYYDIYKAGSPEWMKEAKKDHQFTLVWNRLIKLVTIITRYDTEVERAQQYEDQLYLKKFLTIGQA